MEFLVGAKNGGVGISFALVNNEPGAFEPEFEAQGMFEEAFSEWDSEDVPVVGKHEGLSPVQGGDGGEQPGPADGVILFLGVAVAVCIAVDPDLA